MQEVIAYTTHLSILCSIYAILAIGLNLLVGQTGLLSVMHAAFSGVGAYVTALLLTQFNIPFLTTIVISIMGTVFISFLIGLVLSKFDDDYYALVSLGMGVIIFSIFLSWREVTQGSLGIPNIPRPEIFGFSFSQNIMFLLLVVVFLLLVYMVARHIKRSSFGRVLKAIREDEKAIQMFGYKTTQFKLAIFMIGAATAAIAGSLMAVFYTYISPTSFTVAESIYILAIIILGGLASTKGSVLGAVFLVLSLEVLRFVGLPADMAAHLRETLYGLLLILLMFFRPQGIAGKYAP